MTDITSPDAQTRAAVLESVRVRAALVLTRCACPENVTLIERAMQYRRMYTAGAPVAPVYLDTQEKSPTGCNRSGSPAA